MNALGWWKRQWCRLVGHHWPIRFHDAGVFWCQSAGAYDCVCTRCAARWEETPEGTEALIWSEARDPRRVGLRAEIRRDRLVSDLLTRAGVR